MQLGNGHFQEELPHHLTYKILTVVYSAPGKYDVTLTVTDTFGTSSQTYSEFIEYKDTVSEISNTTSINEDFENIIFPPESWNLNSLNYNWMTTTVDFGIDCQPTTTAFVNHYWSTISFGRNLSYK